MGVKEIAKCATAASIFGVNPYLIQKYEKYDAQSNLMLKKTLFVLMLRTKT